MRDVHALVPQDALFKVRETGVRDEPEDLLVHGDDLISERASEWPTFARPGEMRNRQSGG
jgi:hypothetical protein